MFKEKLILPSFAVLMIFFSAVTLTQAQLDDPTRPPGYRLVLPGGKKAATETRFLLSSVRISPVRRSAIVNDRSVETGDIVNGAKVIAIYPASVKLKKKGKVFTVRLVSNRINKIRIR